MPQYHIKPDGNPGVCTAKIQCRYNLSPSEHYSNKDDARKDYEQYMALVSGIEANAKKNRVSVGSQAVLDYFDTHSKIVQYFNETDDLMQDLLPVRDQIEKFIKKLPWADGDAYPYDDSKTMVVEGISFKGAEDRIGHSNSAVEMGTEDLARRDQLIQATGEWVSRLSTAEVKSLFRYAIHSESYALLRAGVLKKPDSDTVAEAKYLESAVSKAPRLEKPITVYSGIDRYRAPGYNLQAKDGCINIGRTISTSANPAQANGFMGVGEETVLEIEIDRIASMVGVTHHSDEMEVLVPEAVFRVEETVHDVEYLWGPGELGRTAKNVHILKKIS